MVPGPALLLFPVNAQRPGSPGTVIMSENTGGVLSIGVTLIVMVLADWSRSTPPLAVPPLSCTWKVKLA